jgi:hypothetical protein
LSSPTQIDQAISVHVVADKGRLPRAGSYLQSAVADALAYRTGLRVSPDGDARLDLSIDADQFRATADDTRGVAVRWNYTLKVTALLVTRHGTRIWRGAGSGSASDRAGEAAAIRDAASDAADGLARWLATVDLQIAP